MTFTSFGSFSRPDIGLVSDSTQNLAEIFDSDKRDALRNILIRPEVLDSLYKVSEDITREDLRSASGLSRLLLPSLHQLDEISLDRVPTRLYVNKEFYGPEFPLGGVGSPTLNKPNVVLFNGSIQCAGAQYRANTIGTTLFTGPVRQNVSLSTSRASLFNAEVDPSNLGYYLNARYPGSIRVRRRSHVNRIFLPQSSFLTKAPVVENPSHAIRVNIDNGDTGTSVPVRLLATKNTPLRVYCKMATGKVIFTFTDSAAPYFFGYQIQPAQQRPNSPPVDFLPITQKFQQSGSTTYELNIDITDTGYQNLYDLYLYLYVNPEKVSGIEFSGIDIREFPDRKDLGLIGFNNLRTFRVSGGSMTILPLWLKTLSSSLTTIDLSGSGDTWRNGPMGYFDYRNGSAVPSFSLPLYTGVSYLTVPKTGTIVNEDGTDWNHSSGSGGARVTGEFEKYVKNLSRTAGTDYRQFSALTSLSLGDRFLGLSPRFDDVFPNLRELLWSRSGTDRNYRYLFGSLPKINNHGNTITSYNIGGSGAQGALTDIGTSATPSNSGHVSKYKVLNFIVNGEWGIRNVITGYIGNPSEDWSAWFLNTASINMSWTGSGLSINLQSSEWKDLTTLRAEFSGGAQFTNPSQPLLAPKLSLLSLYGSGTTGQIPSLGTTSNTSSLAIINIGSCNSLSAEIENGISYLLPTNFAPVRAVGNEHRLEEFYVPYFSPSYRIRRTKDLSNLYNLTIFSAEYSGLTGRFPVFPLKRIYETETKGVIVRINGCNFYDLTTLSINQNNSYFSRDVRDLIAWDQNLPGGGAILPSFEGTSTSGVRAVVIENSQPSTYRSDWIVPSLRGSCVRDNDPVTSITGLSITRAVQTDPSDSVYTLTGVSNFLQRIMVGDEIRTTETGTGIARVLSVSNTSVIIDRDIPGSIPSPLYFARRTNNIETWFGSGFTSLLVFRSRNCRLSGTLNIRSGFSSIRDDSYVALDLSRNIITGYQAGSLGRIFSGNSRKITVDLSSNNLSSSTIREIVNEISLIDATKRFNNCQIRLGLNKLDSEGKYINYTQNEIFPVVVSAGTDRVTSLFRNETFNIYSTVTTTDASGNSTTTRTIIGTRTVSIPGELVSGTYYKKLTQKTQISTENSAGLQFKKLQGIRIDLGFTYVSPSTSPTVISSVYSDITTRNQSIIDAGYDPADLTNP